MTSDLKGCVLCERGEETVPLLLVAYRGKEYWICSQHLPILIHDPGKLAGKIPGAEDLPPADHQD